jgi:hypothetical protein
MCLQEYITKELISCLLYLIIRYLFFLFAMYRLTAAYTIPLYDMEFGNRISFLTLTFISRYAATLHSTGS